MHSISALPPLRCATPGAQATEGRLMTQDPNPKRPTEKVGAYAKPEKRGGSGTIITAVVLVLAVILILWLFTDII
jgi:hypothetical protein